MTKIKQKLIKKYNLFGGFMVPGYWLVITALIIGIMLGKSQQEYPTQEIIINQTLIKILDTQSQGSCSLSTDKTRYFVNEEITGMLTDGSNTLCGIYYEAGAVWNLWTTVITGSSGQIRLTGGSISAPGIYRVRAVCGSCPTNTITLTIMSPDSDGDGFTDDEELAAGTDPNDPNDYPGSDGTNGEIDFSSYTCGDLPNCDGTCPPDYPTCIDVYFSSGDYYACVCTNSAQEIHPEWKPGGSQHNQITDTTPESYNCVDADVALPFEERLATASYCTDDLGKHNDYCDAEGYIRDWYCVTSGTKKYCTDGTANNCPAYCGAGSICSNGRCTITEPLSLPPGIGWSSYKGITGSWYQPTGYPDSWYPFNLNLGSRTVAIEYWVAHYSDWSAFVDTTHTVSIRGVNSGSIVCSKDIIQFSENHGILLCTGESTSNWNVEINNKKTENVIWKVGWYTWTAPQ